MDQLPRLGKRELICLLLFTCNYVVSVLRGFLFLWVLEMGYAILLWHSLSLPCNYFGHRLRAEKKQNDLQLFSNAELIGQVIWQAGRQTAVPLLVQTRVSWYRFVSGVALLLTSL